MKVDLILLKQIHHAVNSRSTGTPEHFAEKLGVSLRTFHENREFMIGELSAPIAYSRLLKTYYYTEDWELYIGDINRIKAELIKGLLATVDKTVR